MFAASLNFGLSQNSVQGNGWIHGLANFVQGMTIVFSTGIILLSLLPTVSAMFMQEIRLPFSTFFSNPTEKPSLICITFNFTKLQNFTLV